MRSSLITACMAAVVVASLLCGLTACDNGSKVPAGPTPLELELPFYFGDNFEMPEDNPLTEEGVLLGRHLFYDKRLSGDNTMACASCHLQEHAFTDAQATSRGIDGISGTKSAMSLANLLWVKRFFWDGRSESLENQALQPITDPIELHQSLEATVAKLEAAPEYVALFEGAFGDAAITPDRMAKAMAQFQRTLVSANSKYDRSLLGQEALTPQEALGRDLFFTHPLPSSGLRGANCGDCHLGPLTAGSNSGFRGFHNNGLDGEEALEPGVSSTTTQDADKGKFRAPTLRNIAVTAPYMHDGRLASLEDVLDHYNEHVQLSSTIDPLILGASNEEIVPGEPVNLGLTDEEKAAVIAFLHTLTDDEFLTNPAFGNPFEQ